VDFSANNTYKEALAACRETQGCVLFDLDRDTEAKDALVLALDAYQQLARDLNSRGYRERLAVCQSHYGQLLHKLRDYTSAKTAFDFADETLTHLIDLYPDVSSYQDARAFVQRHRGQLLWTMNEKALAKSTFAAAKKAWETLIAQDPQPEYCDHIAWFLANCPIPELQASKVAVEYARQATTAVPNNARYHATLGAALYRQGEYPAAIISLETAEKLASLDDGRINLFLALAHIEGEHFQQAAECLEKGIQQMEASRPGSLELRALRREAEDRCGRGIE
jgi:tetratricopeptide (TPR) repeat protein